MTNDILNDGNNYYYKIKTASYFLVAFIGAFTITYLILYVFGMVPESLGGRAKRIDDGYIAEYWLGNYEPTAGWNLNQNLGTGQITSTFTTPDRIIINQVGIDTVVEKPTSRNVDILDQYLTRGAVYYPGSGSIEKGNIFVFGHSSNLAVVRNQAYKTFNGIEKLVPGDQITVVAGGKNYTYRVNSVRLLNADETQITFDNTKRLLTLTTCNTFGAKQERWVVEAEFQN